MRFGVVVGFAVLGGSGVEQDGERPEDQEAVDDEERDKDAFEDGRVTETNEDEEGDGEDGCPYMDETCGEAGGSQCVESAGFIFSGSCGKGEEHAEEDGEEQCGEAEDADGGGDFVDESKLVPEECIVICRCVAKELAVCVDGVVDKGAGVVVSGEESLPAPCVCGDDHDEQPWEDEQEVDPRDNDRLVRGSVGPMLSRQRWINISEDGAEKELEHVEPRTNLCLAVKPNGIHFYMHPLKADVALL